MNQLPVLIRREFWEHRNTFVVLPAIITAFFLAMMLLTQVVSMDVTININSEDDKGSVAEDVMTDNIFSFAVTQLDAQSPEAREYQINKGLQFLAAPLMIPLWFVIFFYLLNALYADRRDRSILFWKSMPVSDGMTVMSKLITGLWLVPFVYLAGLLLLQLMVMLMLSLATRGTDIPLWETIWGPASIFSAWIQYIGAVLFYSLWALPFFGWLLAVSAWAKSVPLVWAMGLPFALVIVEGIVSDQNNLARWMSDHMVPLRFVDQHHSLIDNVWDMVLSLQMVSAIAVGGVLIFVAIWMRGKADEI